MADWRVYTGTQRLQIGWTLVVVAAGLAIQVLLPGVLVGGSVLVYGGLGLVWLLGLVGLAYRDRRAWRRLVEASSFERGTAVGTSDLERIVRGHTVSVSTTVPSPLAQSHTRVRATVDGVDADFSVTIRHVGTENTAARGLTTGNEALDDRFVVQGAEGNVKAILSTDVQAALMDLETPATVEIDADRVVVAVPFTRLSPGELEAAARVVVELVDRVEVVGQS
jgi:hypothetical protein